MANLESTSITSTSSPESTTGQFLESEAVITLDHGAGAQASQRLFSSYIKPYISNPILDSLDDAAKLNSLTGDYAFTTDAYTVSPLFFAGGSIGSLAINGTVNDLAMLAAKPLYLSCSLILEEGLPLSILEKIVSDLAKAADFAQVQIVTGDTKVVPRGACDQIFITTAGIGKILAKPAPSGSNLVPGDAIIISGAIGDHGLTILNARENLTFLTGIKSDCAPLNHLVQSLVNLNIPIHCLRDVTRGGLATTLNELANQSQVEIEISEKAIPIHTAVKNACDLLGLDPLHLANEGKCLCIVPSEYAKLVVETMHKHSQKNNLAQEAAIIGQVVAKSTQAMVTLKTSIGGRRILAVPEGGPLPRIC